MTSKSQIEWTEQTWNPAVGCTKVSAGCKYCYAETMANRLKFMGTKGYENGFRLTLMPDRLEQPLHRKIPTTYFVNLVLRKIICLFDICANGEFFLSHP